MKVFFFDIDGTLANGLDVPASAAYALKELRKKGHLVFICTGRPDNYVKEHFGQYCDGSICFNGRFAELHDEVLYDVPLTMAEAEKLADMMAKEHCGYLFYNNTAKYYGGWLDGEFYPFNTDGERVYNFNVFFEDFEHYDRICEVMKDVCIMNPHGNQLHADATVIGSDKGKAIREVLDILDIPLDDSYAFGDGANDVCMMKAVGHGICMGNGLDVTKAEAEYVTTDMEDNGIYNALVHYGLID